MNISYELTTDLAYQFVRIEEHILLYPVLKERMLQASPLQA
jgi:hypothetical protein